VIGGAAGSPHWTDAAAENECNVQFDVSYGFCELIFAMQIALCKKRRCRDEATEEPSDERVWLAMSKTGRGL
jgi:hypothetical protein